MKTKVILFFGPPGSGKGTQRKLLEEELNKNYKLLSFSVGSLIRDTLKQSEDNYFLSSIKKSMNEGNLLPSSIPIWAWTNYLLQNFSGQDYILIDGGGRKPVEAELFLELFELLGIGEIHLIILNITEDEIMSRLLKRQRTDDEEDKIRKRLEDFNDTKDGTAASIKFLRQNCKVHDIDGLGSEEEVFDRIKKVL